jgi:hypothetical protein
MVAAVLVRAATVVSAVPVLQLSRVARAVPGEPAATAVTAGLQRTQVGPAMSAEGVVPAASGELALVASTALEEWAEKVVAAALGRMAQPEFAVMAPPAARAVPAGPVVPAEKQAPVVSADLAAV